MKSAVKVSPVNMEERQQLDIHSGDTVRVWQKIEELKTTKGKNKKDVTTKNVRRQAFEGLVLAVKHGQEPGATFTVRRVASGVGVEKIFPLYSPMIDGVEILRRARTRRAKLYFIRRKAEKEARRLMRKQLTLARPELVEGEPRSSSTTVSEPAAQETAEAPATEESPQKTEIAVE